jgi:DNA (cytosine-5)-methyltransferase 1
MTIQVVDFFAGCGGTSLGLRNSGMSILAGLDNDPDAAETYRLNFPEASFFERDIRLVSTEEVGSLIPADQPILFSGCAPCQPFSKQNRHSSDQDERRNLLPEFARFVLELRPDYVFVENVPGLQKIGTTGPFISFVNRLRRAGYSVRAEVLPALSFGVPQVRKRLVLLAGLKRRVLVPTATHGEGDGLQPISTVRDWIQDLPPIVAGERHPDDSAHVSMELSNINLRRIRATPEGGGRGDWDESLVLDCHAGHRGHSDVYWRMHWDRPASAMTTRCLSYSNGRYGHPEQDRAISLREAACLQTFPLDFAFSGSFTSGGRQVGNAVPPLMAKSVGRSFLASS